MFEWRWVEIWREKIQWVDTKIYSSIQAAVKRIEWIYAL